MRAAEAAGFDAGFMVSEHFHPWTPQQGQSAFAWSFMGALGQRTSLPFGTAVTCPGLPLPPRGDRPRGGHARARCSRAGSGSGLGAGEALNEHVIGGEWPEIGVRSAMMFESIEIINKLFTGNVVKHKGEHFTLESAKLYTRPETSPVPIYVATAGPVNAKKTGKFADGMITVGAADEKIGMLWDKFDEGAREAGKDPSGTPKLLQIHVSWAPTDEEAIDNALLEWPNGGMAFPKQDIKNPEDFAAMAKLVRPEHFTNRVLMSVDLAAHTAQHPALRGHGLRRDPSPQRRSQPGRVHRGLRARGPAQPPSRLTRAVPDERRRRTRLTRSRGTPPIRCRRGATRSICPTAGRSGRAAGDLPRRAVARAPAADRARGRRGRAGPLGAPGRRRLVGTASGRGSRSTTRLREPMARIVGARPLEVAILNTLTVNLHLLLTSFFRPDGRRRRILVDAPALPVRPARAAQPPRVARAGSRCATSSWSGPRRARPSVRTSDLEARSRSTPMTSRWSSSPASTSRPGRPTRSNG